MQSPDEIEEGTGFLLSYGSNNFFTSALNTADAPCFVETNAPSAAATWYFEPVEGAADRYYSELVSDSEGMLSLGSGETANTVFDLPVGTYQLVETSAPPGYLLREGPVEIIVTDDEVTYDEGSNLSFNGKGLSYDPETRLFTMTITNTAGYSLPSTGGPGAAAFYLSGALTVAFAGLLLALRKRK